MDDFRYTYAVARVNALSASFLDREFASRMLSAEVDDILGLLGETALAESFSTIGSPHEIEQGILDELRKTYDLLERICPEKELIRLFRYRYDFHNLKTCLKSRITGSISVGSLIELGTCDTKQLAAEAEEGAYCFIPAHLSKTAVEATAEYDKTQKLSSISSACDRSMWRFLIEQARSSRNKIVYDIFKEYINLANIKTFFRVREFASNRHETFASYFIPGGSYEAALFSKYMDEELGLFLNHLTKTRYDRQIVSEGLMSWPEDKSFWRIEMAFDNFLIHHLHQMRHQVFSIAPLVYYLFRKLAETRLIRTVTGCKLIGMERGRIEERLRYIYV
jgi:V/A-type H+-transporting ATPase subunit C